MMTRYKYPPSEPSFCDRHKTRSAPPMQHMNTDATAKLNLLRIAKQVLKLNDYVALHEGAITKTDARQVIRDAGWSEGNIANLEG